MRICEESVRAALDPVVGQEMLSPWDKQRILRAAQSARRRTPAQRVRRLVSVCAVFALCLLCATGVLASMPGYAQKLSMLSQEALGILQPVEEVCEAAGLRMEVIAAMNDGHSAVVYLGLTDLTGQDRLDETASLPSIRVSGMDYVFCENAYEREDGALILRLRGTASRGEPLDGCKVTLYLEDVLLQNTETDFVDTGLTVAQVAAQNPAPLLEATGRLVDGYEVSGGESGRLYQELDSGRVSTLKAVGEYTLDGLPWLTVRSMGLVNGSLHILLEPDSGSWYNTVDFLLADETGPRYDLDTACLYLGRDQLAELLYHRERYAREEQLLALPEDAALDELHIGYYASTYAEAVHGDWQATFVLQGMTDTIEAECALDMQPWLLTRVTVSPVGVSLEGSGALLEDSLMPEVVLTTAEGDVCVSGSSGVTTVYSAEDGGDELVECSDFFDEPLELEAVQAVSVCGVEVWRRAA